MRSIRLVVSGLAIALLAGCGATPLNAVPHQTAGLTAQAHARAEQVLGMREAYALASQFATTYGDDFKPMVVIANAAFDPTGKALPTTWRFTLVGHLRGQADFSWVKVQIDPSGKPTVDPKRGGPFPDRNDWHKQPMVDPAAGITAEDGMAMVMSGMATKYPPGYNISVTLSYSDRLKCLTLEYDWATKEAGQVGQYCDSTLDPATGEVIENDASSRLAKR